MRDNSNPHLGLRDLDPKLGKMAREKYGQVKSSVRNGSEMTRALVRQRAVTQQAALYIGNSPISTLHMHELADIAILAQVREENSSPFRASTLIAAWASGPVLIGALVYLNLSRSQILLGLAAALAVAFFPILQDGRKSNEPTTAVLAALLPILASSSAERSYIEAIREVFGAQDYLGSFEARAVLLSLNSLLESDRVLAVQHESIMRAMNTKTLQAIEDERDRIVARIGSTADTLARQTFEASLAMCESRLERARRLLPVLERIEAQQESIRQTMMSVQTSLAGLSVGAVETLTAVSSFGPQAALLETTRELQNRAADVEKAVQEVALLRGG